VIEYHAAPQGHDDVLRFFDNCPKLDDAVGGNESAWREYARFPTLASMAANMDELRATLGAPELTADDVDVAYEACAYVLLYLAATMPIVDLSGT